MTGLFLCTQLDVLNVLHEKCINLPTLPTLCTLLLYYNSLRYLYRIADLFGLPVWFRFN